MSLHPAHMLTTLREPDVRLRWLAQWLRGSAPETAVAVLEEAAQTAALGHSRELHLTFIHLLLHVRPRPDLPGGPLPPPDRRLVLPDWRAAQLIGAAHRLGFQSTAWLLRESFRPPMLVEGRLLPLHPSVERIALGVRKERARVPDVEVVTPLLADSTPAVIHILGENPRILEAHALLIATLRPTHPYALQALLLHPRWLTNVKVVEAVVRSDAAPPWLVLALTPLLARPVQMAIVNLPRIHLEVRELIAQWLHLGDVVMAAAPTRRDPNPGIFDVTDEDLATEDELAEVLEPPEAAASTALAPQTRAGEPASTQGRGAGTLAKKAKKRSKRTQAQDHPGSTSKSR